MTRKEAIIIELIKEEQERKPYFIKYNSAGYVIQNIHYHTIHTNIPDNSQIIDNPIELYLWDNEKMSPWATKLRRTNRYYTIRSLIIDKIDQFYDDYEKLSGKTNIKRIY